MTNTLTNGIYRIKTSDGSFSASMAIQMRDGKGRPMRITNANNWGKAAEDFRAMADEQVAKLAEYGLHDNQSVANHSI
jgi:hypothetical protein